MTPEHARQVQEFQAFLRRHASWALRGLQSEERGVEEWGGGGGGGGDLLASVGRVPRGGGGGGRLAWLGVQVGAVC